MQVGNNQQLSKFLIPTNALKLLVNNKTKYCHNTFIIVVMVDMCFANVQTFIEPDLFDNNVPSDNTTPIYLINLLWKLGLGLGLDLRVALF